MYVYIYISTVETFANTPSVNWIKHPKNQLFDFQSAESDRVALLALQRDIEEGVRSWLHHGCLTTNGDTHLDDSKIGKDSASEAQGIELWDEILGAPDCL